MLEQRHFEVKMVPRIVDDLVQEEDSKMSLGFFSSEEDEEMATGVDFLPFSTSTLPSIASSAVVSGAGERSFPSGFPSSLPSSRSRFVVGSHTPQFARRRAASVKRFRRLLPEDVARMQRKNSSGSCLVADYDGMLHENGYSLGFTPLPNTFPLELALRGV